MPMCVSYLNSSSVLGTSQNLSQPVAAAGKQTSKPPKPSQAPHHSGEEPSRAEEPGVPQAKKNRPADGHTATYPRNQNRKKRRLSSFPLLVTDNFAESRAGTGIVPNNKRERPRRLGEALRKLGPRVGYKRNFIENWLSQTSSVRKYLTNKETLLPEVKSNLTYLDSGDVSLPDYGLAVETGSRKSKKTTASVNDTDYRHSLSLRNIFIEKIDPPPELLRRAKEIISYDRKSPGMDDETAKELTDTVRRVQNANQSRISASLGPLVVPAMRKGLHQNLEFALQSLWFQSFPIPLDPLVDIEPLPLPTPKPDLAFGYSQAAFNKKQLMAIEQLTDKESGLSYAAPDEEILFPFLVIEFKSSAKGGTIYVAMNQVAGAGAIGMKGSLELMSRASGADKFDFHEPGFFSVAINEEYARLNIHWISDRTNDDEYEFHVATLSRHFVTAASDVQALRRSIQNILDYASGTHLKKLKEALDAYKFTVKMKAKNPKARPTEVTKSLSERESVTRKTTEEIIEPPEKPDSSTGNKGRKRTVEDSHNDKSDRHPQRKKRRMVETKAQQDQPRRSKRLEVQPPPKDQGEQKHANKKRGANVKTVEVQIPNKKRKPGRPPARKKAAAAAATKAARTKKGDDAAEG